MRQPFDRYMQIEIAALGSASLFALFAFIKTSILLALVSLYLIVISLACDAMLKWELMDKITSSKQFGRAIILLLLSSYIFLHIR